MTDHTAPQIEFKAERRGTFGSYYARVDIDGTPWREGHRWFGGPFRRMCLGWADELETLIEGPEVDAWRESIDRSTGVNW